MLQMSFGTVENKVSTLLCIGAHCDDIEIGCGGTILRLVEQYPDLRVRWVVLTSSPERAEEARNSAERFLEKVSEREIVIKDFPNSFLPYVGGQVKEFFERLKGEAAPDLVLTHTRRDLHQDHRVACELTWNTFRNHLILEYEVPKYDGDLGAPNLFVPLSSRQYDAKVNYLLQSFPSQHEKPWFTKDTFLALMRLRGVECNAPSGYAEAFYCPKVSAGF